MPFSAHARVPDTPRDTPLDTPLRSRLAHAYDAVRARSRLLAMPLSPEDQCVQSMPDASPVKWHLAHTTWFFETMVLQAFVPGHRPFDPQFAYLFNSYYEALGPRHPRPTRGLITRPSSVEVLRYRGSVDAAVRHFLTSADDDTIARAADTLTLGLHHEQQHQELLLTDVLHLLSQNPTAPCYREAHELPAPRDAAPLQWLPFDGGQVTVGHRGDGFAFDNEGPAHAVLLHPHAIASRPVTCGEYLDFIRDGGYRDPQWWLSDGWAAVNAGHWDAPLYWSYPDEATPLQFTLFGQRPVDRAAPVSHLSLFEAAAYANWAGARLPTEFEWEAAVARHGAPVDRHNPDLPLPLATGSVADGTLGGIGEVWEWTRSAYDPFPGFKPFAGAAGEYNGKFMVGQVVLRGASCATPPGHTRSTYRNFFPPSARWQFSGLRLAKDL